MEGCYPCARIECLMTWVDLNAEGFFLRSSNMDGLPTQGTNKFTFAEQGAVENLPRFAFRLHGSV